MRSIAGLIVVALACIGIASCESNGQTGSLGYACFDDECAELASGVLKWLAPSPAPTFVESACHEPDLGPARIDTRSTYYCTCTANDGTPAIIPTTMPYRGDAGTGQCIYRGRGGLCVFWDGDVTQCDPGDPDACRRSCDLLQARLADNAKKDLDGARIRFARCVTRADWTSPQPGYGRCGAVFVINDACYGLDMAGFLDDKPHDCSVSDQEIVSSTLGSAWQ